ncbi:MAG TPA: hypothetical protein VFG45_09840 [Candidatus Nitrosocosmicus sp.]|nr:hypothetical protein [Candidatus Nitrosocosmicus sp.]
MKDQNAISKNVTNEIADRIINRLVKEGRLVESKENWYYRNDGNGSAAAWIIIS